MDSHDLAPVAVPDVSSYLLGSTGLDHHWAPGRQLVPHSDGTLYLFSVDVVPTAENLTRMVLGGIAIVLHPVHPTCLSRMSVFQS